MDKTNNRLSRENITVAYTDCVQKGINTHAPVILTAPPIPPYPVAENVDTNHTIV